MIRARALIVALACLTVHGTVGAIAEAPTLLSDLDCVAIVADDISREAEDLGVDRGMLHATLKVSVAGHLPDLKFDEECNNELFVQATVLGGQTGTGMRLDYTASLRVELRRMATLIDSRASGMVTVWDAGTLLAGRPADARNAMIAGVKDLAAAFSYACSDPMP